MKSAITTTTLTVEYKMESVLIENEQTSIARMILNNGTNS